MALVSYSYGKGKTREPQFIGRSEDRLEEEVRAQDSLDRSTTAPPGTRNEGSIAEGKLKTRVQQPVVACLMEVSLHQCRCFVSRPVCRRFMVACTGQIS